MTDGVVMIDGARVAVARDLYDSSELAATEMQLGGRLSSIVGAATILEHQRHK